MTLLYSYDQNGEFLYASPAQTRPNGEEILDRLNATPLAPQQAGAQQAAVFNGTAWTLQEDHRQKRDASGVVIEGSGTAYWLPSDDWQSPARYMTTLGALPAEALTTCPAKPLDVLKQDKLAEITTAYETVLAYVIAPEGKDALAAALAVADFAADDPEGLAFIRAKLAKRKAELETAVNAAATVSEVQAVSVGFAV